MKTEYGTDSDNCVQTQIPRPVLGAWSAKNEDAVTADTSEMSES